MDYLEGLTLTKPKSYATVVLTKDPNGFLVEFPKNKKIFARLVNIQGAFFGDESPYPTRSFYIPRHQLNALKAALEDKADWRDPAELQQDLDFQNQPQETLQDVLSRISPEIDMPYMKVDPYNFQKLAVVWAAEPKGPKKVLGGLLGDQMGLGKTMEGMATACYFKSKGWVNRTLVITLASVKDQFGKEIEKFTNEKVTVIKSKYKGFEDRKKLYDQIKAENPFFTVINYELLHQREVVDTIVVKEDKKTGKVTKKKVFGEYLDLNEILNIGYDMVILDEAHKIKNPYTLVSQAVRQIEGKHKLLMTGTPIQKELKNIFHLFDYIDPSILSDPSLPFEERKELFETNFLMKRINPFVKLPKNTENLKDELIQVFGEINENALRKRFNPFFLRRKSEDVSDEMPDEVIKDIAVEFNEEQFELLEKIQEMIDSYDDMIEKEKDPEKSEALEKTKKGLTQTKLIVCDSPSLLLESESPLMKRIVGKKKKFQRVEKLEALLGLVEQILDSGEKVVIFTRYAKMADLIKVEVDKLISKKSKEEKSDKFVSFVYKGSTSPDEREKMVQAFQTDDITNVFISTEAGSTGINLQRAQYLINYDFSEESSTYLQRKGRIRRLGSKNETVFIYDLMTTGGKDEQIYKDIQRQIELNDKVIENRDSDNDAIRKASKL